MRLSRTLYKTVLEKSATYLLFYCFPRSCTNDNCKLSSPLLWCYTQYISHIQPQYTLHCYLNISSFSSRYILHQNIKSLLQLKTEGPSLQCCSQQIPYWECVCVCLCMCVTYLKGRETVMKEIRQGEKSSIHWFILQMPTTTQDLAR